MNIRKRSSGFSLMEILLIMVIVSTMLLLGENYRQQQVQNEQIDKTVLEIQQILSAALAYYVANGKWPDTGAEVILGASYQSVLQGTASATAPRGGYLPNRALKVPYSETTSYYKLLWYGGTFTVRAGKATSKKNLAIYNRIAARLPGGKVTGGGAISATVDVPGQNVNNATALNFAGNYHHGDCVPVPTCPNAKPGDDATQLQPQIFVAPVSVSGANDPGTTNLYPISSFSVYAMAKGAIPDNCSSVNVIAQGKSAVACTTDPGITQTMPPSGQYWRVCMQIITENNDVQATQSSDATINGNPVVWGDKVLIAAFTRCGVSDTDVSRSMVEPEGTGFTVFTH